MAFLSCRFDALVRIATKIVPKNQLKDASAPTLAELAAADIRTVMVTGDNLLTAIAVARDCELVPTKCPVMKVSVSGSPPQIHFTPETPQAGQTEAVVPLQDQTIERTPSLESKLKNSLLRIKTKLKMAIHPTTGASPLLEQTGNYFETILKKKCRTSFSAARSSRECRQTRKRS